MQSMVVKEKDWVVANDVKLDYLRIYPKCHVVAPEGKTVTNVIGWASGANFTGRI